LNTNALRKLTRGKWRCISTISCEFCSIEVLLSSLVTWQRVKYSTSDILEGQTQTDLEEAQLFDLVRDNPYEKAATVRLLAPLH
jgi:hypothetical protein